MSTHKHIDKICCVIIAIALILTVLFINGDLLGIEKASALPAYEAKLFDTTKVHKIEIIMDDWESFIETCTNEEYSPCSVVIDNEAYKNVAIRAKGNTSLSSVRSYGNDRYSFKIEFDGYENAKSYHGLDKLCLNNVIQDNTYMKDHLVYTMMREAGASAPLSSYAAVYINGEYFGLYLAVESVEDSFLSRNYGKSYGELYKPDSMKMGGGRGNGKKFDLAEFNAENAKNHSEGAHFPGMAPPSQNRTDEPTEEPANRNNMPGNFGERTPGGFGGMGKGGPGGMRSSDVSLIYTDDNPESYSNIFSSAKTKITEADKTRLISALKNLNENKDIANTVNIDEVIRYFVAHNFVLNFDSYTGSMIHNYYLYEENGKLSMIPWDYNLAFGGFQFQSDPTTLINYPIDSPVSGGTIESRPMLAWIFSNEEYTNRYHKIFSEFISDFFNSGKFEAMMDSTKELIAPYIENDPSKFCTYEEFETGISTLREFCILRAKSISKQLDGSLPSTSDGQANDNSAFVNADHLLISAMGSMGRGMGKGGFGEGFPNFTGLPRDDVETSGDTTEQLTASFPTDVPAPPNAGSATLTEDDIAPPGRFQQGEKRPDTERKGTFGAMPEREPSQGMNPPDFSQGDGMGMKPPEGMPGFFFADSAQPDSGNGFPLLYMSLAVLAAGLCFAFFYKR